MMQSLSKHMKIWGRILDTNLRNDQDRFSDLTELTIYTRFLEDVYTKIYKNA